MIKSVNVEEEEKCDFERWKKVCLTGDELKCAVVDRKVSFLLY